MLDHIRAAHGRLDVLVNNAGIAISHNIETCTVEDFDRTMSINLEECLPRLQAQPGADEGKRRLDRQRVVDHGDLRRAGGAGL
ncbi:SDR family NAD(P)-dependent oxidoreductase [Cupriavidus basilensis]